MLIHHARDTTGHSISHAPQASSAPPFKYPRISIFFPCRLSLSYSIYPSELTGPFVLSKNAFSSSPYRPRPRPLHHLHWCSCRRALRSSEDWSHGPLAPPRCVSLHWQAHQTLTVSHHHYQTSTTSPSSLTSTGSVSLSVSYMPRVLALMVSSRLPTTSPTSPVLRFSARLATKLR